MKANLKKFDNSLETEWDYFVANDAINGTFLHTRKFYNHNPLNIQDDNSYLFYKKNTLIGIIPFNLIKDGENKILNSYLRATYGGFLVSGAAGIEEINEMVELVVSEAKKLSVNEIIIRNPFRIFNKNVCDESDYAMWLHGFKIKYRELEIAIKLGNKETIQSNYSDSASRSIKKGKTILSVEESFEFQKYWKILEENLSSKYDALPTHNFEQFSELLNNVGKEKIKLFTAKFNDVIIAGIVVFVVNEIAVHAQYIASDIQYQEHRALNVIIDFIIDWASARQFKFLNLGMANEDNGEKMNIGLFRFKEGFGGRGVIRETMHLQLNHLRG